MEFLLLLLFRAEILVELPYSVNNLAGYSLITYILKAIKHIHINFTKRQFNYIVWPEFLVA